MPVTVNKNYFGDMLIHVFFKIFLGIPYRRGYLLYGPPGCGKSSFMYVVLLNYIIYIKLFLVFKCTV